LGGPRAQLLEGRRIEGVDAPLGVLTVASHTCLTENTEVARDRRSAHGESVGDLADGAVACGKEFDDLEANRVGEDSEQLLHLSPKINRRLDNYQVREGGPSEEL